MSGITNSFARIVAGAVLLLITTASSVPIARADSQMSPLPAVGSSQQYTVSEQATMMSLGGTLGVSRQTAGSVRITTSDGLPAADQTQSVDPSGMIQQTSPASPFIDLLNYVAAILAAAPSNVQKGSQWDVKLSGLSPLETAEAAFTAGTKYNMQSMPRQDLSVTVATKLVSVVGNTMTFHGEGKQQSYQATIGGNYGESVSTTIDFVLKSGLLQSCTRTTVVGLGSEANPMNEDYTTSFSAK
jgi:hypothetical protein